MKRQADEELEDAPSSQRRSINLSEPEHEEQSRGAMIPEEMPQEGPSTSGGRPVNRDEQPRGLPIPEEVPQEGPSTSRYQPVRFQGADYDFGGDPSQYSYEAYEQLLGNMTEEARRFYQIRPQRPIDPLEPEPEEQQRGAMVPEEVPQEGPSTSGGQPGGPPNPEHGFGAYHDLLGDIPEEVRLQYLERRHRREAAGTGDPLPVPDLPDDHPQNFFPKQIDILEAMSCRKMRLMKIWVARIRVSETSTTVIPRIYVLIGFGAGVNDLVSYRPSEENPKDCIVKRRGNPEEMIVRDEDYQELLCDHLYHFLMACGKLSTTIEKVEFVVDSNPLIPTNRLSCRSNGPEDSFLEQFRTLWLDVDDERLVIETMEVQNRFRPLREAFHLAQYAICDNVIVRPMKFEEENIDEVRETLGVFGPSAVVNQWHIRASEDISRDLRFGIRIPHFTTSSPCYLEIIFKKDHPMKCQTQRC